MKRPTIAAIILTVISLSILGCGGTPVVKRVLPENIMADPSSSIGVILHPEQTSLPTALRTLGIPYHRIPIDSILQLRRYTFSTLILDEGLLENEKIRGAYQVIMDAAQKGGMTVVILQQPTEFLAKESSRYSPVVPRTIDYPLHLLSPRDTAAAFRQPNLLTGEELDSLSVLATQLARGNRDARGVIAANLFSPDSSAAVLWQPMPSNSIWYISVPITARAATGYSAQQKLLANILSTGAEAMKRR